MFGNRLQYERGWVDGHEAALVEAQEILDGFEAACAQFILIAHSSGYSAGINDSLTMELQSSECCGGNCGGQGQESVGEARFLDTVDLIHSLIDDIQDASVINVTALAERISELEVRLAAIEKPAPKPRIKATPKPHVQAASTAKATSKTTSK